MTHDANAMQTDSQENEGGEESFPMPSLTEKLTTFAKGHRGQHEFCGACTYHDALARISELERALYRSSDKAVRYGVALKEIRKYPEGWKDRTGIRDFIDEVLDGRR
jgi:hypothetical protein